MSEEASNESSSEPVAEETPKKNDCLIVSEPVKPLLECCEKYERGEIGDSDFFATTLIHTGELMKRVKQERESRSSE